ncbi:CRISPR-associated protein Cas3 [Aureimonas sp. Leaf454]|uniref:CRISPR-associated endonuclease Cas3'' n=1 Tax=Aureimonas sp. Leaf454 TaxID=1736381 RepID=UPI0006F6683B|nr:CRISPR-associated endonuclease Cas3'' [Aureimonas sp. Leaf454]KQT50830.1 CRISPR-associated protein Cas3 [Aureimonas sp. Leaf454]
MAFHAHSTPREDRSDWDLLSDHLYCVARRAESFGTAFKIGPAAEVAGRRHDLGKYTAGFQERLSGGDSVDHSTAGAAVLLDIVTTVDERMIATLIAQGIAGHHAGLPDRRSFSDSSLKTRVRAFDRTLLSAEAAALTPASAAGLLPEFAWRKDRLAFQFGLLGRMIFSCLVDADYKETEGFYERIGERRKDRYWPSLAARLPEFLGAFEKTIASFGAPRTPLAALRREILDSVLAKAEMAPGLFTLTVPTGGGKTLASLGFALNHARIHRHRRIVVAIPFTSIIDQTAAIFRDMLGEANVLEHHSGIETERINETTRGADDARSADGFRSGAEKMRLAMEDWAAPVIVTTHVQLFESLFAARPGRCRKLHNLAGSIIVLDEAQTLPRPLLSPTVQMLDELARNYGCSIILCTATQPAFDARRLPAGHPLALELAGRELAPDPARHAASLRRTCLVHAGVMDDEAIVAALSVTPQALVIVNSRRHALDLFRAAEAAELGDLVHLTTRQCGAHRREILADVRHRLKSGEGCRLIATSLVEAGVDIDFPLVWRAEAGLDQIAQAAGRCNREGERDAEASLVTVFKPKDHRPPVEIAGLIGDMARIMDQHADLFAPDAMADYFEEIYWRLADRLDSKKILKDMTLDPRTGVDVAYRTIAEKYRMIESGMEPIIVPRGPAAAAAVKKLWTAETPSGAIARDLQLCVVQVPPKARRLLLENGHVEFVNLKDRADQFAVLRTPSLYDETVGLLWENADYIALEDGVI